MFFRKFDFLSPEICLFYNGQERHSSIFSGILSLFLFIFVLFLIIFLSIDFIYKKNPTAYYYNKYVNDLGVFHLNSSGIFHFIFFIHKNSNLNVIDNRAISIIGTDINFNDAISLKDCEMSHYIYELCNEEDVGQLLENENIYKDLKNSINVSYCIKKYYNNLTKNIYYQNDSEFIFPYLEHGASQGNNRQYGIIIKKCQNDSILNNNSCYDDEKINEYINNNLSIFIFNFLDTSIDVLNFKNPIQYNLHNIGNSLYNFSFTSNHMNFHPLKIRTNAGVFLDRITEKFTFKFDVNEKIVNSMDSEIIGSIHFWMQNEMDIYERLYKKVQDIAGGVDGIVEIFMMFIKFFNLFFFNDFQVISDFNYEIEKKVMKYKNSKNFNSEESNKGSLINSPTLKINNYLMSPVNKIMKNKNTETNSEFNLIQNNTNNNLKNINTEKFKIINTITKIEQSFRKIKRFELLFGFRMKCMKNNYLSFLINKREKIISEENLIKYYITLKKIKEIIVNVMLVKYKNYNDRRSIIELDNKNKLKTLLNLSGFLKNNNLDDNNRTKIIKNNK